MDKLTIEVDFGRQSYRVFRKPLLKPNGGEQKDLSGSPFLARIQRHWGDTTLPIYDSNRTAADKTGQIAVDGLWLEDIDKKSVATTSSGILTAVHIPRQTENNFENVSRLIDNNCSRPSEYNTKIKSKGTRKKQSVDMNKFTFDLVNAISTKQCTCGASQGDMEVATVSSNVTTLMQSRNSFDKCSLRSHVWIGSEYRYIINDEKLVLNFIVIGQPWVEFRTRAEKMFIVVTVTGGKKNKTKRLNLSKQGNISEITFHTVSFVRTLEMKVQVQLYTKGGFLRQAKRIDQWEFGLNDCHYHYQRSFWQNVKSLG